MEQDVKFVVIMYEQVQDRASACEGVNKDRKVSFRSSGSDPNQVL